MLLHVLIVNIISAYTWGGKEALIRSDINASSLLPSNKSMISDDFYNLTATNSASLLKDFKYQHGGKQSGLTQFAPIDPIDILGPGLLKLGAKGAVKGISFVSGIAKSEVSAFNISVSNLTRQTTTQLTSEIVDESLVKMAQTIDDVVGKRGYDITSKAVRSALADRVGKRGFTEVGYQFQKHLGRGGNWGNAIPNGVTLNPKTFNEAGHKTFQEIWRGPGSFRKVGGFIEKRLPDGRGIRFQDNLQFKGFLD